jgi:tetratricopeptide (TPR) repeat protein
MPEIREALVWAFGPPLAMPAAMLIVQPSADLWRLLSLDREGLVWLRRALDEIPTGAWVPQLESTTWSALGQLLQRQGDLAAAADAYQRAASVADSNGWAYGSAIARTALAGVQAMQGDYHGAADALDASITFMRATDDQQLCNVLATRGTVALALGERATATELCEEALALARTRGNVAIQVAALNNLSVMAQQEGRVGDSRIMLEESLALRESIGDTAGVALSLVNLANAAALDGDLDQAAHLYRRGMVTATELGYVPLKEVAIRGLAEVSISRGDAVGGAALLGAAEALRESIGRVLEPYAVAELDGYVAKLRDQLTPEELAEAWERGRGLSPDKLSAVASNV